MAATAKVDNKDKLKAGFKSIVNRLEVACDKIELLQEDGDRASNKEMRLLLKSVLDEERKTDFATTILGLRESVKNEKSYYLATTGMSFDRLPEKTQLESVVDVLLETGVGDYNSNCLFSEYLSMAEKCVNEKNTIDDIDECINKLKTAIGQQHDLKCELSHLAYSLTGYTAEPIPVKSIKNVHVDDKCVDIVKLVKKIDDIEKKQMNICEAITVLKSEQKKMYHGLPPNIEKATMAVKIADKALKDVSKKLLEKL